MFGATIVGGGGCLKVEEYGGMSGGKMTGWQYLQTERENIPIF